MRIVFTAPVWPAVAAVMAAAATMWLLARSRRLPRAVRALRLAAVCALALLALGPELVKVRRYEKFPGLAVLVDSSVYMKGPSGPSGADKFGQAADWCRVNRAALQKFSEPSFFAFGRGLRPLDPASPGKPESGASDLAGALGGVMTRINPPPARILVITDGNSRAERGALRSAKTSVPVDFIAAGVLPSARDLRAGPVKYSEFAFLHLPQKLEVSVTARGLKGWPVNVTASEAGVTVASASFVPARDYEVTAATLTVRAQALGTQHVLLKITAPGVKAVLRELNWQVIHEKRRIMYLCGRPSYDYSLLRDYIKSDPNNELVTFVILRNPENYVPAVENELSLIQFPAEQIFVSDIDLFDVVILDNFSFNRLGLPPAYALSLAEFVKKGGALLAMGTDNIFSPAANPPALFETLPVEISSGPAAFADWQMRLRPHRHPVTELAGDSTGSETLWLQLAPVYGVTLFQGLKKGAEPVFSAVGPDGKNHLMAGAWRYGKGRVMAMGASSTWRWKMLAADNPAASASYNLFWAGALAYLNGSLDIRPVSLSADLSALAEGETGVFTLRALGRDRNPLNDATPAITAEAVYPDGRRIPLFFNFIRPGVFQAELPELARGRVTVRAAVVSGGAALGADTAVFPVRPRESDVSDLNAISALAAESGGRAYLPAEMKLKDWAAGFPPPEKTEETLSRKQVCSLWSAGALVLALLAAEWLVRRLKGIL
ncbi:MAG: hypothetical protein PHW69_03270 [Elusimicrobiaceae bacterium]|nr:hypothetical protein [Elusimicrobiaceae bacterium]